jgi:WD40 repeat protein
MNPLVPLLLLLITSSAVSAGEFRVLNAKMRRGSWGSFDASFSPDGKVLAATRLQGTPIPRNQRRGSHTFESQVILWDVETGEKISEGPMVFGKMLSVQFLPGGDRLATARGVTGGHEVGFWSVAEEGRVLKYRKPQFIREVGITATTKASPDQIVTKLAVSPDGDTLAAYACYGFTGSGSVGSVSTLRLWPKSDGSRFVESRDPETFHIRDLCFSQDSQQIIALVGQAGLNTNGKENGFILTARSVDDPENVTFQRQFDGVPRDTAGLCAIPKTSWLAMGGNEDVLIFDLKTHEEVFRLKSPVPFPVTELAVSADGKFLAAGTEHGFGNAWIVIWKLDSQKVLANRQKDCRDLEFSPDSRFLAIAGNQLYLWDISEETGASQGTRGTRSR